MKAIKTSFGKSGIANYIKALFAGLIFGVVVSATLLCVFAAVILGLGKIPYTAIPYIVIGIFSIGAFLAGYISARILKIKGLMFGLISGGIMFILALIGGFIFSTETLSLLTLLRLVAFTLSGALGGIKGVNRKDKLKIK